MKKGALYTLEAFVGISLIFLMFFLLFSSQQPLPELKAFMLKMKGIKALKALDENNELRKLALLNNSAGIEEKLRNLLPPGIKYEVKVCGEICDFEGKEGSVIVHYLLAGDVNNISPRQVALRMVMS